MTSAKMPPNTGPIMIAIFVDFVLDIDDGPCKNGFPGRYVKFQLEFLESKVGGIGPLKLLFQANLFHIVKSLMSKTILPLNFVGLLYPRYQVIQIVSYDMNVWIVVLHKCRNENEKMKKKKIEM
jgi:hypothetical protein